MGLKSQNLPPLPYADMPQLPELATSSEAYFIPDDAECYRLWQKYGMLANIKRHSRVVACIAEKLALRAKEKKFPVSVDACRAAGLLHDLAKTHCIKYGGAHAMLGAAWTLAETSNYAISQGVLLHVHWPWELPVGKAICILPIFVLYADKRARHDECVTLTERFEDILQRYGKDSKARKIINFSWQQNIEIEKRLSEQLEWDLHEDSFDCGRLVE